ncbi:hypothetical protein NC653_002757 [Populus alba x Populus x berolinensis]|uniref:Uncharacterized protein n=2 Tax=Populus TaxID=3689 RepID=A0A4V6ABU2_POPAL|nr:hypothetical protein NC653_002757 [Populus alba x Populus x berolinensis]TKS16216.1 hypothetical protein D5086_0000025090 [Populus alba]
MVLKHSHMLLQVPFGFYHHGTVANSIQGAEYVQVEKYNLEPRELHSLLCNRKSIRSSNQKSQVLRYPGQQHLQTTVIIRTLRLASDTSSFYLFSLMTSCGFYMPYNLPLIWNTMDCLERQIFIIGTALISCKKWSQNKVANKRTHNSSYLYEMGSKLLYKREIKVDIASSKKSFLCLIWPGYIQDPKWIPDDLPENAGGEDSIHKEE